MSTAAKLAEALAEAMSSLEYIANTACKRDEDFMAEPIQVRGYARSRANAAAAALAAHRAEQADQWRDAVDQELVVCHLTVENFPTPQAAVRGLIDWHCSVQIDPAVSSAAQALIDEGYRRGVEDAAAECEATHANGNRKHDTWYECADAIRALIEDKP